MSENVSKVSKGYHKLLLWQRMTELVKLVYSLTDKLPKSEDFGLKTQMRRAAVSVVSNFVEGYLKTSQKHKLSFLEIAKTSLLELEAQAEVCKILNYWLEKDYQLFEQKRGEVGFLLFRYSSKLKSV
ncbi:MAG: four helix bundle protein [Patescibacteria group bacterium]|nr:four helix bundle protein [Patescibacteria group bacterium]